MQRAAGKFIPRLERDLTRGDHSVEGPPSSRKRVKQTRHRGVDNVKIEGGGNYLSQGEDGGQGKSLNHDSRAGGILNAGILREIETIQFSLVTGS